MLRLVCAWVLVNGLLLAPGWVSGAVVDGTPAAWISLEAALVVGGMTLLPRRAWSRALAWALAAGLVASVLVLLADLVFRVSLGRTLDLSLDLYLVRAVYDLAIGNTGPLRTVLLFGGIAVAGGLAVFATGLLLTPAQSPPRPVRRAAASLLGGSLLLALIGLLAPPIGARVVEPVGSMLATQVDHFRVARAERATFAADLASEPAGLDDIPEPFARLGGRHVVVAFIESYGMAAFDDPQFASVVEPRMEQAAERLNAAGIGIASGQLVSPTMGGQSWYAHGTFISGLWLENQLRWDLLLASEHRTLVDDFSAAGYRTAVLMPAITTAWPEAERLRFDDVYTSQNIPYAGPPLYWVTMPDQYTWAFLGKVLKESAKPLFVEAGMLSSHAPWTPVLPLVDWDALGDGSIFEPFRQNGYPPEETWWDVDVLRDGYARSLAYSLEAMAGFAEHYLGDSTLLIVLGDHQAAPWVTGDDAPNVPVHVLARDPALLAPFQQLGFATGGVPDEASSPHRMDEMREWLVRAFSGSGAPTAPRLASPDRPRASGS
jgi:hypothetical protein